MQRRYQRRKYVASLIGWIMNTEQLVEWKLVEETDFNHKFLRYG
jgi:hypothetical protein